MKTTIKYIVTLALTLTVGNAWAWHTKGHEVIAMMATERLAPAAKVQVESILGGDMASNSLWLNELKKNEATKHTRFWHNATLDAFGRASTTDENDGLVQLERNIEILRNRESYGEERVMTALRVVIHLVSDLHCYAHIRFEDIPQSKNFTFYRPYKGKTDDLSKCPKTTWYKVWAKWFFDMHGGFSHEMFINEIKLVQGDKFGEYMSGTPREWVEEMGRECRPLFDLVKPNEIADDAILLNWEPLHERCVAKAAVRLAVVLNSVFAK